MSDLSKNEYFRPHSPEVLAALTKTGVRFYSRTSELRNKIAAMIGAESKNIRVGNGAEELLIELFQGTARRPKRGRTVLLPDRTWPLYEEYMKDAGTRKISFPTGGDSKYNVHAILKELAAQNPYMTVLCSPNNPTSTVITPRDLETVLKNTRGIVVLDQTYHGFDNNDYDYTSVFKKHKNLVIVRSFSKMYGLAGARIGWALIHEETVRALGLPRRMLGLSTILENLGIAALDSRGHYEKEAEKIVAERGALVETINATGAFSALPSKTNFVFLRGPVEQLAEKLTERGITIHVFPDGVYKGWARFGIGTQDDTSVLLAAFRDWKTPE